MECRIDFNFSQYARRQFQIRAPFYRESTGNADSKHRVSRVYRGSSTAEAGNRSLSPSDTHFRRNSVC